MKNWLLGVNLPDIRNANCKQKNASEQKVKMGLNENLTNNGLQDYLANYYTTWVAKDCTHAERITSVKRWSKKKSR